VESVEGTISIDFVLLLEIHGTIKNPVGKGLPSQLFHGNFILGPRRRAEVKTLLKTFWF
jgi:hypothetical protein